MTIEHDGNDEAWRSRAGAVLRIGDRDASAMIVCGTCGGVRGPWRYAADGLRDTTFMQRCRCDRDEVELWPRFDFNTSVELCWCCAAAAIHSGSRWSHILCPDCHERAVALRRRLGRSIVPIGRHSLMNGVGMRVADAVPREAAIAHFVQGMMRLRGGITALWERSRRQTSAHLASIGAADAEAVPLTDYLAAVAALPVDKAAVFAAVCREFGVDVNATGDGAPIPR